MLSFYKRVQDSPDDKWVMASDEKEYNCAKQEFPQKNPSQK